MDKLLKIGTRDSELAIWQSKKVQELLHSLGVDSELVFIKSEGDIDLATPLYALGVQGVFTKSLDIALITKKIDIAVHSYKDVPTTLANGTCIAAVLERDDPRDLLIYKSQKPSEAPYLLATSSVRRTAQWLHKYPQHSIEPIRGNVNTRIQKLHLEKKWDATILSKSGVDRIGLSVPNAEPLDWMLPAPAQGTIVVTCRIEDENIKELASHFHHKPSAICTKIEKDFLRILQGGCSTPIAAYAKWNNDKIYFQGNVLSTDGKQKAEVEIYFHENVVQNAAEIAVEKIKQNGAWEILTQLKS